MDLGGRFAVKTLDSALLLARQNIRVTPVYEPVGDDCSCPPTSGTRKGTPDGRCKSPGKHPVGEDWQKTASNDQRAIHAMFRNTSRNLGVVCDEQLATLDIDPRNGGLESLAKLIDELGPLPTTWHADTGGNGQHMPYRHPGGDLRATFGSEYPGVDVLRGQKQFLVEPSIHVSGNRYKWRADSAPWECALADLPPAWIERLRRKPAPAAAPRTTTTDPTRQLKRASAYLAKLPEAIQGQHGSDALWMAVCWMMHGFNLSTSEVKHLIVNEYNPRCQPPWSEYEIDHKIDDARDAEEPHKFQIEDRPLPEDDLSKRRKQKAQSEAVGTAVPGLGDGGGYRLTELGNARRFADAHRDKWRYDHTAEAWREYVGTHWQTDTSGSAHRAARAVVAGIYADAAAVAARAAKAVNSGDSTYTGAPVKELADWASKSARRSQIDNMLALASTEIEIAATSEAFDADPFLFNVLNGTINLRTGALCEHRREDLITKIAPVVYSADARSSIWERFLEEVQPDEELRRYIQRWHGYCLTGSVREQKFVFNVGKGGNGKNVFEDAICAAMGQYAITGAPDLLLEKRNEAHPTELKDLKGVRLVLCSEIEPGRAWAEARIKQITGDRTIRARGMKENFQEFISTSKLVVLANTKPRVRGTDDGLWRRMQLVPWNVQIPTEKQDKGLLDKIIATELPGVLTWLVRGCVDWQKSGLGTAKAIETATAGYRSEQDVLGLWIRDCCKVGPNTWHATDELHANYLEWCKAEHIEHPWSRRIFRDRLLERSGIYEKRQNSARGLEGIRLLSFGEASQ